jgi:hypothetical protein
MVLNSTFNNISVILWRSVLLVDETGGPGENPKINNLHKIFKIKKKYFGIIRITFLDKLHTSMILILVFFSCLYKTN